MSALSVEGALKRAIEELKIVHVVDRNGRRRIVEPHMLFQTGAGVRQIEAYQVAGESRTGRLPNWRHFPLDDIHTVFVSEEVFSPQPSFNPFNRRMFPHIELRVPTAWELGVRSR